MTQNYTTTTPDSLSTPMQRLHSQIAPVLVLLYILLALMVFIVAPILFMMAARTPFIGAFVEHTLLLNTAAPARSGSWGEQLRLPFGYQVVALDGEEIFTSADYFKALNHHQPGDQVNLVLRDPQGKLKSFDILLMRLPVLDQISYFVIPYFTGLVYLLSGMYVFSIRRYDPAGRAFAAFSVACAIAMAALFDGFLTHYLAGIWTFSMAIIGAALLNLALLFPESLRMVVRYPFLGWGGYALSALLGIYGWITIGNFAQPTAYVFAWRLSFIFIGLALIFFLVMIGVRRYTAPSPIVREQARLIFWGSLVAFGPMGVWFFLTIFNPSVGLNALLLLPLGIFPVATGYAIIRYRLINTDYILSRSIVYAVLTGLSVSTYVLLVLGFGLVFGDIVQATNPVVMGLAIFLLAVLLLPVRRYLQGAVDRYFFRGRQVYREKQQAFARELGQAMELNEIIALLRQAVDQTLLPTALHIYVYDPLVGYYVASKLERGAPSSDVRFAINSPLVQTLGRQREILMLSDLNELPEALHSEQSRLALLNCALYVPMLGRRQLIGWLALDARLSGEPYTSLDMSFLDALSSRAALAVERAQVVSDLERRVRETNVLTRVAQGVSFTMSFDDILELISAQTGQVLPARDFRVTLYDPETEILSHAFYLEDDDRLHEHENHPLPNNQGLEWEVIRSQRPVQTDDYERECRRRGLLPAVQGLYAWMSVPLNAGAETIGAISVASRDPAVVYTDEQRGLLQAIADQASGAIVKARLLQEAERRAHQLATLNQIGIGLTSTLELRPLLNQILDSAAEILNCEAGSLFLVDRETDELVFEVVIGPAAPQLLGRRLPPGAGLVGEAVLTGRAIIANDAKRRKEWFDKTDIQTGFDTQDLLVVPMRVQDRTIGVIEVINKRNGAPFSQADQDLLTTFTSQATIAIENVRLYTMTDQALEARVEELSVMQRIDRELNASLDIERAMRITLDWAMRQSRAEAGLVGAVEAGGIRVVVAQGYGSELAGYQSANGNGQPPNLPIGGWPALQAAIESGQPQHRLADTESSDGNFDGLLYGAQLQVVIPIRQETETVGILLLESSHARAIQEEVLGFLTRLSDHAAIAITNARLFEEVQEANLAKSRFVSFVAHELKNPMASIKGYTELVAGGMAGPVNEMQSSFLATVRSNVDRMNTIVSDLNDLTKIQVGNLRLEFRTVDIKEILDATIRSLIRQIEEKNQQLTLDLPADIPLVWADPARVEQILVNLVSNAQKYTPANGEFTVAAETNVPQDDTNVSGVEYVHLWVKDTGIGISQEDQARIFQLYFRTDSAKEMASGTGLGLAITKSLVEMQGGRIWFESAVGLGTTFHVMLPVAEAQ